MSSKKETPVIWTVIAINPAFEKAEHHVLDSLSHDREKAYEEAQEGLPNRVIVAMVRGNHKTSTHVPDKIIQVVW